MEPYVGLLRSRRVDASELADDSDNCHEGIEGRGGKVGKGGVGTDVLGVRLSNSVFRDLRSCCNSPNDCV
jgi:hypothetical protein